MGKVAVQLAEERILANGGKVVPSFKGAVRSDDLNTLEKGDQFTIPTDFKIYEQRVGNGSNVAQFIIVDVNGVAKNFYPSSLQKNLAIVDDSANSTGERAKTKGTACDWFKRQGSIDKAMKALKGHTLVITDITPYQVKRFGTTDEVTTSNFMTVDFVGDAPAE